MLHVSIHGGRVANALACNTGCHGFAPPTPVKFLRFIFSNRHSLRPARRDFKWSVWHCMNLLWILMSAVITGKKLLSSPRWAAIISTGQSSTRTHTCTHTNSARVPCIRIWLHYTGITSLRNWKNCHIFTQRRTTTTMTNPSRAINQTQVLLWRIHERTKFSKP